MRIFLRKRTEADSGEGRVDGRSGKSSLGVLLAGKRRGGEIEVLLRGRLGEGEGLDDDRRDGFGQVFKHSGHHHLIHGNGRKVGHEEKRARGVEEWRRSPWKGGDSPEANFVAPRSAAAQFVNATSSRLADVSTFPRERGLL